MSLHFDFEIGIKDALKSVRFWHLFFMLMFGIFFGVYVAAVFKVIAIGKLDDRTLTFAGALGYIFNGSSRILWASLLDRFRFRTIYFIILII